MARFVPVVALLTFSITFAGPAHGQIASASLSGRITDTYGAAVSGATITIKNAATGEAAQAQTDSSGSYALKDLIPGDYQVTASARGFASKTSTITLKQSATQTVDFSLVKSAPPAEPSLSQLGFPASETQGSAAEQARLNKRSHMLQIHQRLGLITTVPLIATVITGGMAGGRSTSSTDRDLHAALGATTAGLYFATAYYAIFAPKIPGTKTEGNIKLHKVMAWIHGPGMVLTPILGAMAFEQKSKGERIHGIAQAHGAVAIVTAGAYGVAILSVSLRSGPVSRSAHHIASVFGLGHAESANTTIESGTPASR